MIGLRSNLKLKMKKKNILKLKRKKDTKLQLLEGGFSMSRKKK